MQDKKDKARRKQGHVFHLKMDEPFLKKLEPLCKLFDGAKGAAGVISRILEKYTLIVEKEHFFSGEQPFAYNLIHPDREIKRKSVQIKLDPALFRRLKMIHQDLNYFSIAQIVRKLVYRVLMLWYKYQDNLIAHLEEAELAWRREREKIRKSKTPLEHPQLWVYKLRKPPTWLESGHKTEYNRYYAPTFYYLC